MRLDGFRSLLLGALVLVLAGAFAACENPLDPINKSDKIEGLSFVDFSASWERWDSDPEFDGVSVSLNYYNQFGEGLSFHDKPHNVVIEFWTERDTTVTPTTPSTATKSVARMLVQETLWFSKTIRFENSDDTIRIPIEAYSKSLPPCEAETTAPSTGTSATPAPTPQPSECEAKGFMVVRVFPPQEFPRAELVVAMPDVLFFKPVVAQNTPNQ